MEFGEKNAKKSYYGVQCHSTSSTLCVFEPPLGGSLGTTYDVYVGLIGKCVVDFLLVLIELFFASCYGSVATSENRSKIGDFAPTQSVLSKISRRRGRLHQTFLHR